MLEDLFDGGCGLSVVNHDGSKTASVGVLSDLITGALSGELWFDEGGVRGHNRVAVGVGADQLVVDGSAGNVAEDADWCRCQTGLSGVAIVVPCAGSILYVAVSGRRRRPTDGCCVATARRDRNI